MARTIMFSGPNGPIRFVQSDPAERVAKARRALPAAKARRALPANPKRFVLGVAYPAGAVDGHGEFIRADELEARAWDYVRKGRQIGFYHADGTVGHAEPVESYIFRGPDWHTTDIDGHEQVIKAGDWVLGAICDEPGFAAVVNGPADGWSIDGKAKRRNVPRSQVARGG